MGQVAGVKVVRGEQAQAGVASSRGCANRARRPSRIRRDKGDRRPLIGAMRIPRYNTTCGSWLLPQRRRASGFAALPMGAICRFTGTGTRSHAAARLSVVSSWPVAGNTAPTQPQRCRDRGRDSSNRCACRNGSRYSHSRRVSCRVSPRRASRSRRGSAPG